MSNTIKSITGRNVKGLSFNAHLEPVNLIIGTSFSGKTAILDALKLAVLGYHPDLGNKANLTMDLCPGSEMEAGLVTSDGKTTSRTWKRNSRGSVKAETSGDAVEIPSMVLDFNTFLSLSGPKRIDYIFSKCDMGDGESWPALALKSVSDLSFKFGEQKKSRDAYVADLKALIGTIVVETPQQDVLAKMIEKADELQKHATAEVKRLAGIVTGHEVSDTLDDPRALQQELEQHDAAIQKNRERWGKHEAKVENYTKTRERYEALVKASEEPVDGEEIFAELRLEVGRLAQQIGEEKQALDANTVAEEMGQVGAQHRDMQRSLDQARAELKAAELGTFDGTCPHCGDTGDDYDQRMAERHADVVNGLAEKVREMESAMEALVTEAADWSTVMQYQSKLAEVNRIEAEISDRESKAAEAERCRADEPNAEEGVKIDQAYKALTEDRAELNTRYRAAVAAREVEKAQMQAAEDKEAHEISAEVGKAVKKALLDKQREAVNSTVGSILEKANEITGNIIGELVIEDGTIGMVEKAHTHKTFSGTEQALAFAAIGLALNQDSPVKVMVLDELGRLDSFARMELMRHVDELIKAGTIDQFIGAMATYVKTDYAEMVELEGLTNEINVIDAENFQKPKGD